MKGQARIFARALTTAIVVTAFPVAAVYGAGLNQVHCEMKPAEALVLPMMDPLERILLKHVDQLPEPMLSDGSNLYHVDRCSQKLTFEVVDRILYARLDNQSPIATSVENPLAIGVIRTTPLAGLDEVMYFHFVQIDDRAFPARKLVIDWWY